MERDLSSDGSPGGNWWWKEKIHGRLTRGCLEMTDFFWEIWCALRWIRVELCMETMKPLDLEVMWIFVMRICFFPVKSVKLESIHKYMKPMKPLNLEALYTCLLNSCFINEFFKPALFQTKFIVFFKKPPNFCIINEFFRCRRQTLI